MRFVTQGTVQIEVKHNDVYVIRINPVQDYAVKHNSDVFIVFVPETKDAGKCQPRHSYLFKRCQEFDVDVKLGHTLIHAAIANTKVEIIIEDCTSPPALCTIQSIKIPATLLPDK
jgi:hypothetical protein